MSSGSQPWNIGEGRPCELIVDLHIIDHFDRALPVVRPAKRDQIREIWCQMCNASLFFRYQKEIIMNESIDSYKRMLPKKVIIQN